MTVDNKALVLDLVEWIATQPRSYADVMDAWRTSCPRLPIWEDALDHGFCSVEADVFLVKDQLLVGHSSIDLRPERTHRSRRWARSLRPPKGSSI